MMLCMTSRSASRQETLSPSAGDHLYPELFIRIHPHGETATISLHKRLRRGVPVVWDRRVGTTDFPWPGDDGSLSERSLVVAAAAALMSVAGRMPTG